MFTKPEDFDDIKEGMFFYCESHQRSVAVNQIFGNFAVLGSGNPVGAISRLMWEEGKSPWLFDDRPGSPNFASAPSESEPLDPWGLADREFDPGKSSPANSPRPDMDRVMKFWATLFEKAGPPPAYDFIHDNFFDFRDLPDGSPVHVTLTGILSRSGNSLVVSSEAGQIRLTYNNGDKVGAIVSLRKA